jgi:hypothetical protein
LVEKVGTPDVRLVDILDESSMAGASRFSMLSVEGEDVDLAWRKLPGIEYILCKSSNLENWDEVPVPEGNAERVFTYSLKDEANSLFKLKMNYPEVW